MDFSWNQQQLELRDSAITFAQQSLGHDIIERDHQCAFSRSDWQACADFGIQGMAMPTEYGGQGLDLLTNFFVMEGLGYGCRDNGLTFALNAQFVSVVATLMDAASEQHKQHYLSGICSGALIGAYAMTEPDSGSDAFGLKTTFEETSKGFVLNGEKCFLTFGPVADFYLVFATSDTQLGHWGLSLFLIDRSTPGVSVSSTLPKMGLRTAPMGTLTLKDCEVVRESLVGEEGSGAAIFSAGQDIERAAILASQIGAMEYQLEMAIEHAKSRHQFGKPIGKFQSVSNRIADMKVRLETARLAAYKAVWLLQQRLPATLEAALANLTMAESFVQSSLDAVMIFGGRGYMTEDGVERDLRDAVGGTVYGGTSDIQRSIIASRLGL